MHLPLWVTQDALVVEPEKGWARVLSANGHGSHNAMHTKNRASFVSNRRTTESVIYNWTRPGTHDLLGRRRRQGPSCPNAW